MENVGLECDGPNAGYQSSHFYNSAIFQSCIFSMTCTLFYSAVTFAYSQTALFVSIKYWIQHHNCTCIEHHDVAIRKWKYGWRNVTVCVVLFSAYYNPADKGQLTVTSIPAVLFIDIAAKTDSTVWFYSSLFAIQSVIHLYKDTSYLMWIILYVKKFIFIVNVLGVLKKSSPCNLVNSWS